MRWLPFQLNPDVPASGIPRQAYMEQKFGSKGAPNFVRVAGIGKEVGIDFDFDAVQVQPNTVNAHRLMHYAGEHGRADEVAESVFRAYFMEGANFADLNVLADAGARGGLERAALLEYLSGDGDRGTVLQGDLEAREAGIGGVPFFIFNRSVGGSGAHEPETLLQAMNQALEKTKKG